MPASYYGSGARSTRNSEPGGGTAQPPTPDPYRGLSRIFGEIWEDG